MVVQGIGGEDTRQEAINRIDAYLSGHASWREVSDWALQVTTSPEWDMLPCRLRKAIHALFDLHDKGAEWCPDTKELSTWRKVLQDLDS